MRIAFFGCTVFSERILKALLKCEKHDIVAIFSIPQEFLISYSAKPVVNSNYADLKPYALGLNIPFFEVNSIKGARTIDFEKEIEKLDLDLILVMGWYYMVAESTRSLAKLGAWGIHASLLPDYAGGAPLVWAMIEGQTITGVSLFKLSNGVDDGDIIEQLKFPIESTDTIREVYEKATIASEQIIQKVFGNERYNLHPKTQDKTKIRVYPQRKPEDGEVNWTWEAEKINRFIKAQTKPYPGAWTKIGNKKIILWDAEVNDNYE